MTAVARDVISLVQWMNNEGSHVARQLLPGVRPLRDFLSEFCAYRSLFAITDYPLMSVENERASEGLLTDMFSIAVSGGRSDFGRDHLPNAGDISSLDMITFPGPDALRLGKPPVNPGAYKDLWGTLEDMTAAFINSGPYRVQLTQYPGEHLTLSADGKLRLFWEGPEYWTKEGAASLLYPGQKTFGKYRALTLGR
jgi:hypothetical protein